MGTVAISVSGMRKTYRRRGGAEVVALDGLDLEVPTGGVFGLIGPNGAGKTTAIRALVGHLRATEGTCEVLGAAVPDAFEAVVDRVGAVVETPGYFKNFSGHRNLALLARSRGVPVRRVDEVLGAVGLADRAGDRVGSYSLGMRQRLGLAGVLLKDPELLILDEPANGLDPSGIREMRALVRRLGDEGRTVFVSSHILAELEAVCDQVAVVRRGRCVAQGPPRALIAAGSATGVVVRVHGDATEAARVLRADGFVVAHGSDGLRVEVAPSDGWRVTRALAAHELWVEQLTPVERSLEDAFLELVGERVPDDRAPVWGGA